MQLFLLKSVLQKLYVKGMIVKEVCTTPSNFRSEKTLDEALKDFGIPGIYGIDTRALTRKLRSKGVVKGCLVSMDKNIDEVVAELNQGIYILFPFLIFIIFKDNRSSIR